MNNVITQIFLYPIKGLAGISLKRSEILSAGLKHDRRWMLIDRSDKFISQRELPILSQFRTEISATALRITYQGRHIIFDLDQVEGEEIITAKLWDDSAEVMEVSERVSQWFSDALQQSCRLVKMQDEESRIHIHSKSGEELYVSLADGYPILIIGTVSLALLNEKMGEDISIKRFRPNIVIRTSIGHEEDDWKTISINDMQLDVVKPCARCNVITIDPITSKMDKTILTVLNKYRKDGHKINFGINCTIIQEGEIEIGEHVNITF